jgi:hypothetical protein
MLDEYKVTIPEGESGDWKVTRFEAKPDSIAAMREAMHGRNYVPGSYTRLSRAGVVVMTDTPDEIRDHFVPIQMAKGRVLINGLGLGMVLQGILSSPEVTHIDVVEQSEDVLKLVAPSYTDPRIAYHHADALDIQWPKRTKWDVVWHDIWDNLCSDNLQEMTRLKRKYGRRCSWQGCWGESYCRQLQKMGW